MQAEVPLIERTFETGELRLSYAEGPEGGPALLLLHGGAWRWQSFNALIPYLAPRWHVFALDLRGHGGSGWAGEGRYRLVDFVDDVAAFLQGPAGGSAALLGHSLGGMVALSAAARHPALVRGVVVGDSPLTVETFAAALERGRARMGAWRQLAGGSLSLDELVERLKNAPAPDGRRRMREALGEDAPEFAEAALNLYRHDPAVLGAAYERFPEVAEGYQAETLLPRVDCPVLLLQGDPSAGGMMCDAEVAQAMRLLPRASHVRLSGIGHGLHNEAQAAVARVVVEFLDRL